MQLVITIVLHHDHAPLQTQLYCPKNIPEFGSFEQFAIPFWPFGMKPYFYSFHIVCIEIGAHKHSYLWLFTPYVINRHDINNIIESTTIELNFLKTLL